MATVEAPQSRPSRKLTRGNTELWAWLFMRISGAVLIVLIFGHLFVNLIDGDGINAIDFGFVAGKWADIRWQIWDLLMLWLAMIHGSLGVRTIINDYAERNGTRITLKVLLGLAFVTITVLGTLVIFTFEPCPAGADPELLPAFCTAG